MKYFCTLFDKNYLIKGLTMITSLKNNSNHSFIYILCLDSITKDILDNLNLVYIKTISLEEIEDSRLLEAKGNRTKAEYCWTLASSFTWYVMQYNKNIELITYLDADLLFYSNIDSIFNEIGNASIAIIEHRFSPEFKSLEVNGRFCVEWNSFRRDKEGLRCLNKWKNQCLDWCYYKLEDGKLGDQKYLDEWPELYNNCHIIKEIGAGIAPWNYSKHKIKRKKDNIMIDNSKLVFYHFHQFEILENKKFFRVGEIYTSNKKEPDEIYEIYEKELLKSLSKIRKIKNNFNDGIKKKKSFGKEKIKKLIPIDFRNFLRRFF